MDIVIVFTHVGTEFTGQNIESYTIQKGNIFSLKQLPEKEYFRKW